MFSWTTKLLNMTQGPFQKFFKRFLPIWQEHCYKSFHLPQTNMVLIFKIFYKNLNITTKFQLKLTIEDIVLKLLKNIDISKAAGVDNLPGRFLKDGAVILAKPVTEICNLSIKSKMFPEPCKIAKLKPIFKNGQECTPPISYLFSYYF